MTNQPTKNARPITSAHYASFLIAALGVPALCAFSLFKSQTGAGLLTTSLFIVFYLILYVSGSAGVFGIARARTAQFVIFALLSLCFLSSELLSFASIFRQLGILNSHGDSITDPLPCLYLSVITWTTVGFGDFTPSPQARGFAAGEALLGYIFMAVLVAALVRLLEKSHSDRSQA
jgi:Ion channel